MKKKALLLFVLRVLKMGISVLSISISAKFFGVSIERDQWIMTLTFILVLDIAVWGPINETFRAKFIFIQQEVGELSSIDKLKSMFSFINFVTLTLVLIIFAKPNLLISFLAPKYNNTQLSQLTKMLLFIAPSFLLNQISQFFTSVLNAYNVFYIPEVSNIISSLISVVFIILFAPKFGIYTLLVCYYFGIILLCVLLLFQLIRLKINVIGNPFHFKYNDVKPFILFSLPFFLPYFFSQVNAVVEKSIASTIHIGAVSIVDYSRRLPDIAISVLGSVFTTMLLPTLSQNHSKQKIPEFTREFESTYQVGFLIITCLIAIFTSCSLYIVNLLYNKGSIDNRGLTEIINMCTLYSWSSLPVFLYLIYGVTLLSVNKGKVYAVYGSLAQVVMIFLNFILCKKLGIYTFPTTLFISHSISAVILYKNLPIKNNVLLINTFKGVMLIITCAFVCFWLNLKVISLLNFNSVVSILFNCLVVIICVVGFSFLFKTDNRILFKNVLFRLVLIFSNY